MISLYIFVALSLGWILYNFSYRSSKPTLFYKETPLNMEIISNWKSIESTYWSPFFLPTGDFISTFAALLRRDYDFEYNREYVQADDSAILNLDWLVDEDKTSDDSPVLLVLPGVTGHSRSSYLIHIIYKAYTLGWKVVVFVYPGTDYSRVQYPRFIRSHVIHDMEHVDAHIRQKYPNSDVVALGYSMGACLLTNYLGTVGKDTCIKAAISCSNPWDVYGSFLQMKGNPIKSLYNMHFLSALRRMFEVNEDIFRQHLPNITLDQVRKYKRVEEFDDAITAKVYGLKSHKQLYKQMSCTSRVPNVQIPTFVAHAVDDPIVPMSVVPVNEIKNNPNMIFMVTKTGGHTGWVKNNNPLGASWFDDLAIEWIENTLNIIRSQDKYSIPSLPLKSKEDSEVETSTYVHYKKTECGEGYKKEVEYHYASTTIEKKVSHSDIFSDVDSARTLFGDNVISSRRTTKNIDYRR